MLPASTVANVVKEMTTTQDLCLQISTRMAAVKTIGRLAGVVGHFMARRIDLCDIVKSSTLSLGPSS